MKVQEVKETDKQRGGMRQAGYRQHPKETSSAANKTGVELHLGPCKKMQESLGYNVAHL